METKCKCPACEKREKEHLENEETSFAVLLALMPMITITLFNGIGLL